MDDLAYKAHHKLKRIYSTVQLYLDVHKRRVFISRKFRADRKVLR